MLTDLPAGLCCATRTCSSPAMPAAHNSTMESLYDAVPLLVTVPQMPEQEANAHRVEELGLGRRVCRRSSRRAAAHGQRSTRSPPTRRSAPTSPRCARASARPAVVAAADAIQARLTPSPPARPEALDVQGLGDVRRQMAEGCRASGVMVMAM